MSSLPFANARRTSSIIVLAGLLLAPFAHAEKAIESAAGQSAAPHWSAYIGTGGAGRRAPAADTQASVSAPSPHWSAGIGTGRVSSGESSKRHTAASDVTRQAGSPASAPHWSSKIGTGSAIGS